MTAATETFCGWCGKELVGKRRHAQYCDSTCRGEATRWRQGRSSGHSKTLQSAATPPIAAIRAEQEQAKAHWSMVVDEGILRTFKADLGHHLHADDLEPLGIPGEHRNVIGSQIAKWVNRGYMVECGRRKSAVPSRNGAKSNEYRLTKDGVRHVTVGERGDNSSGASLSGEDGAGGRGQTVGRDARSCARSADAAHDDDSPEDLFGAECPAMASTSAYSPDNEYA